MGCQGCLHLRADFSDSHPADHNGSGQKNHRSQKAIFRAIAPTDDRSGPDTWVLSNEVVSIPETGTPSTTAVPTFQPM